jgi:hypothetical protein
VATWGFLELELVHGELDAIGVFENACIPMSALSSVTQFDFLMCLLALVEISQHVRWRVVRHWCFATSQVIGRGTTRYWKVEVAPRHDLSFFFIFFFPQVLCLFSFHNTVQLTLVF